MRFLIMMTGPTLSLKTVVARVLRDSLNVSLLETGCLGDYPSREEVESVKAGGVEAVSRIMAPVRSYRYRCLDSLLPTYLDLGLSLILDSAFSSRKSRRERFDMIESHNRRAKTAGDRYHLTLVWCHCDDPDLVEARRQERARSHLSPERSVTHPLLVEALRSGYQPPIDGSWRDSWPTRGEPVELVEFDSAAFQTRVHAPGSGSSDLARELAQVIDERVVPKTDA